MKLTIGHIYPDLLNLYGDQGNIRCLEMRLKWRGLEAEVIPILAGEHIDFKKMDILLLGGGSDREQKIACRYLLEYKEDFRTYAGDNGVLLAVCGGYQLLGTHYRTKDDYIRGLGLLDIYTEWAPRRRLRTLSWKAPCPPARWWVLKTMGAVPILETTGPLERFSLGREIPENPAMRAFSTKTSWAPTSMAPFSPGIPISATTF